MDGRTAAGVACLVGAALLGYGYFRSGTVWRAFQALRAGRLQQAQALLDQVAYPDCLGAQQRAYYEWLRGVFACERKDSRTAVDHFQRALVFGLRTANDRSMVECALAEALLQGGDLAAAREHLALAKAHDHKPAVAAAIREVEQMLGNRA